MCEREIGMLYQTRIAREGIATTEEHSAPDTWDPLGSAKNYLLAVTTSQVPQGASVTLYLDASLDGVHWKEVWTSNFSPAASTETTFRSVLESDLSPAVQGCKVRVRYKASAPLFVEIWATARARDHRGCAEARGARQTRVAGRGLPFAPRPARVTPIGGRVPPYEFVCPMLARLSAVHRNALTSAMAEATGRLPPPANGTCEWAFYPPGHAGRATDWRPASTRALLHQGSFVDTRPPMWLGGWSALFLDYIQSPDRRAAFADLFGPFRGTDADATYQRSMREWIEHTVEERTVSDIGDPGYPGGRREMTANDCSARIHFETSFRAWGVYPGPDEIFINPQPCMFIIPPDAVAGEAARHTDFVLTGAGGLGMALGGPAPIPLTDHEAIELARRHVGLALQHARSRFDRGLTSAERAILDCWFPGATSLEVDTVRSLLRRATDQLSMASIVPVRSELDSPIHTEAHREAHRVAIESTGFSALAVVHVDPRTPADSALLPVADRYIAVYPQWFTSPNGYSILLHEVFHLVDPRGFQGHAGFLNAYRFQGFVSDLEGLPYLRGTVTSRVPEASTCAGRLGR